MSAEQALQIVRGISQAAEIESAGADNAEGLREAAGRVCASLMFFLEHPDSRVQVHCAGTMKKCFERYSDAISAEDMIKVRRAYTRCIQTAKENTLDGDRQVALRILGWIVSRADGEDYARAQNDEEEDLVTCPAKDRGGQVAVKAVGQKDDEELRAGLLAEVIKLPQVVSVTFEAEFMIVATRSASDSRNALFLADLLNTIMEKGEHGASLVNPQARPGDVSGLTGGSPSASSTAPPVDVEKDDEEELGKDAVVPGYLDDELDKGAAERYGAEHQRQGDSMPQWTFFAQQNWMDQRRLQEYDDDPSIAARLAKKKKQQQQKREEETSRRSWFASWLGWQD